MSSNNPINLYEYAPIEVNREKLSVEAAELLKKKYGDKITVEMTSFGPNSDWKLTSQGWVGYIPLTPEVSIRLCPKEGVITGRTGFRIPFSSAGFIKSRK